MSKIRRNITVGRTFQVLFYALGFPLMVHLIFISSKVLTKNPLIGGGLTQIIPQSTVSYYSGNAVLGLYLTLALWAIFIIFQLLLRLILKRKAWVRTAIATVLAAILFVAPIMYMEFIMKKDFEKDRQTYIEETNVDVGTWGRHAQDVQGKSNEVAEKVGGFIDRYNIVFAGENLSSKNTDGTETEFNEEDAAWYSPNGMYADGYVFSYKQAKKVLRDYYVNKLAYEAEERNIDNELRVALTALETNTMSDWSRYKRGDSASSFSMEDFSYVASEDEYQKAYGADGTARKYYLTNEKLDKVLGVLGRELGANAQVSGLIGMLGTFGIDLGGVDIAALLNENLNVAALIEVVNAMNLGGTLRKLIDPQSTLTTIDEAFIYGLLEGFSSYQSPTTYPIYYFLENEELKAYAYANYYAKIHGAKVGSVLVGSGSEPKVGNITLDSQGTAEPAAKAILEELDWLDTYEKIQKKYYPYLAMREKLIKYSAFCTLMIFAAYAMTIYVDDKFKKLTVKSGGR